MNKRIWEVCRQLFALVKDLKGILFLAIAAGAIGHIFASMIPTVGAMELSKIIKGGGSIPILVLFLTILVVGRSLLRYAEQLANHYVAFKTLQIIRDQVFQALRRLSPAKLETRNKGELISYITSDIELLEVFYAHTISPVAIALIHTAFSLWFLTLYHFSYGILLLVFHLFMAVAIPQITSRQGRKIGEKQRQDLSHLNSLILDTFSGIRECIQFQYGKYRLEEIEKASHTLNRSSKKLSRIYGKNQGISTGTILVGNICLMVLAYGLYSKNKVGIDGVIVPVVYFMSSFGPVMALSDLANNLLLTFACGRRILALLEEEPTVEEVFNGDIVDFEELQVEDVDFSYGGQPVLEGVDLAVEKGEILGISGKSGSGKSTLLKLIMRFYPPDRGRITINGKDLEDITTSNLRDNESYLTQDIYLFQGSIGDNIKLGHPTADFDEVVEAAKKASIHEFIQGLPQGYDTKIDYVKDSLSTGEMQRISLARAFLQGGKLMILDEPTSNIDSLNEGIILKSIYQESKDRGILIVSHKASTLRIADRIVEIDRKRAC